MSEVELPEMPELEKEERKDKLNTLVAITVTLLVTFMALCKIKDNNIVLLMSQAQADKVDKWAWVQALNIREDITQSKLSDLNDDAGDNPSRAMREKIDAYQAKSKKITDKKAEVKKDAQQEEQLYDKLDEVHEKFDHTEGAISIAVSLLAMTTLSQKRWLYAVALIPAAIGIILGVMGLLG